MAIGEGRAATLHGPWPDPDEQQLAAIKTEFGEYAIWRAMRDDRAPTQWCARHHASGTEFDADAPGELVRQLREHRGRS